MQISGISSHISNANISGKQIYLNLLKFSIGNNPISFKGLNQNASQLPTQPQFNLPFLKDNQ
jgi:hypothetical protein